MKRKLISLLLTAVLLCTASVPALAAPGDISDVEGHWAQDSIEQAISDGWVDGYPDGTFRPEGTITRAEFVKMVLDAIHLTPNSAMAYWLTENSVSVKDPLTLKKYSPAPFSDMATNWLTTQGWLEVAVNFGLVVPSDYGSNQFGPSTPITRREIAVMVDRAMGKVYPASQPLTEELPFTDADQIPEWVRGYINEAVKAGVLTGYPDGTFGHSKSATRAEAVVMVQRMLDYTREGIDPDINLTIHYSPPGGSWESPAEVTTQDVRMQLVGQVLYASLPDILAVQDELMAGGVYTHWHPIWQQLFVGTDWNRSEYRAGSKCYNPYASIYSEVDSGSYYAFRELPRMLDSELMIPIYDFSFEYTTENRELWDGYWDNSTRTVTLYVFNPGFHYS